MKDIKKEIQEELKNLAPSLSKMEKKNRVEVPENYFKELPDQILSQLDFPKVTTEDKTVDIGWRELLMEKISLFFQPRIAMGFAMVTLLMFSFYFLTKNATTTAIPFAEISEDEMEAYVKENIEDFEEDMIFDFVAENEANNFDGLGIGEEDLDEYMNDIIEDLDDEDLEDFL